MRYIFNIVIVMVAMFLISPLSYAGGNEYSLLDHCPNQRKDHVFVQSVDIGASVGVGGYVALTSGIALTNKGVYAGGKDVTSQAKALYEKIPTPFIKD